MGTLMRIAGMVVVSVTSFIEIVYVSQNLNITNWTNGLFLLVMFILYFLLAMSSMFGDIAKYASPIIGMTIDGIRLYEVGMAKLEGTLTTLISTYSGIDVVLSLVVAEIFIFAGFFMIFLGAIQINGG